LISRIGISLLRENDHLIEKFDQRKIRASFDVLFWAISVTLRTSFLREPGTSSGGLFRGLSGASRAGRGGCV
jgi:hypothetical protein